MHKNNVTQQGIPGDFYCYTLGLVFMLLNKVRHSLKTYAIPRSFSSEEVEKSIAYTLMVCDEWREVFRESSGDTDPFLGKNVLEVGPGPDIGNGLVLIARGAKSYLAVDKFNLITQTQSIFYENLLKRLEQEAYFEHALESYKLFKRGEKASVQYAWDASFSFDSLASSSFDVVVSRAAMEHFEDVEAFLQTMKEKMVPGGWLVSLVDMQTHTRHIRDIDPLNILRYSDFLYHILGYNAVPNRLRLRDYTDLLAKAGFHSITTQAYETASKAYVRSVKNHLNRRYRDYPDLEILSAWLVAQA